MPTWIALLRGINVGGNNLLPMARLKDELESLNCQEIRTYIQSGNVVFKSAAKNASTLSKKIAARIEDQHGFRPHVLVLSPTELKAAIESNPFPNATAEPTKLHFCFLERPAVSADRVSLDNAKSTSETYKLTDHVFYLHAPEGIGRSKLAANIEKYLGVVTTGRNYRTVDKIAAMVAGA